MGGSSSSSSSSCCLDKKTPASKPPSRLLRGAFSMKLRVTVGFGRSLAVHQPEQEAVSGLITICQAFTGLPSRLNGGVSYPSGGCPNQSMAKPSVMRVADYSSVVFSLRRGNWPVDFEILPLSTFSGMKLWVKLRYRTKSTDLLDRHFPEVCLAPPG